MNNPSGDEENTYHVQNVSDSSGSNNSDSNIREQLNTYDTYNNFNRFHEANIEVRQFDDIYVDDSNDDTNYSPKAEGYVVNNRGNSFDGPRSYKHLRPVNENELEFVIDDFIERVKDGESFMSPWRQTPSCVFRLLFLRKRKQIRNGFETYFSAFIETIRKDDWVSDWGFYDVQYYIILFNLIDYRRSFYKADHFSFNHLNTDRGWHEFIDADQLSEPGFIHNDGHIVLRAGMYPYGSENYKNTKEGNYNSKMRTGFVGLKNHGATCYMNALLQLLYHINIFRNAVCMMVFNIEKTIGKQTLEFYKKKLIKKKKKKKALLQRERALERERALQHLERLKKEGAITRSVGEGNTGVDIEARMDMGLGIRGMGVKNEIVANIGGGGGIEVSVGVAFGAGPENGNIEDIVKDNRIEIEGEMKVKMPTENIVEGKIEQTGEETMEYKDGVKTEQKMEVETRNILEMGIENQVEMTMKNKDEMENTNTIGNEQNQGQQEQKEHERKQEKENELKHGDESALKTGNENIHIGGEQVALNTEHNREQTEVMGNYYKTDSILLKLAERVENVDDLTHKNLSGVAYTRRENAVTDDNIKDPFVDCESSSDPSIGTSGNGMHIFGNLDETLVLDRGVKNRLPGETMGGRIDLESRGFLSDENQEKEAVFAMRQKEMLSKRMRELEMDMEVERNVNGFSGHSEGTRDVNNFVSPLLNDRTEAENLFNSINNSNINDMTTRDVSQLKNYDSDDLEKYSWDASLSDSNLSVLSLSSSGSSSYKTCSSSASCCYKKKKNKNKFLKSKEISYRNILLEEEAERRNAPAVSLALQNLFYKLHTMREAVSCKELIRSFGWDASDVFTQQDTHELLKLLLDKVEEQMKGTIVEGYVKKLFEGEVETYIECIDIEYKSLRKETYEDIQLDVQGCNNIYESLDKAIEAEILEGDNIYETDGFGKQRAKKGMRFLSFPNICIFLLKRFTFDLQKMETVKLNNHFEFYKELDLSKYCPGGGEYVLQAVSVHQGSMNSGHYYSFSYKHDEKVWIKCDDEKIFRVSEYSVINDNFGGFDIVLDEDLYDFNIKERLKQRVKHYSAYMLVYVKKSLIPNLIKECNPAMVNPQVVRRCKLEEIINRKRIELRQKILQYIKVKVYDKYSYMYKSFRDLPVDGIPALFNKKFDRNTSIWEVYRKIIKAIEKIYDRKKKKRNTKMCKQTNKKQKTLQMLDHCMNAEITLPKRDNDDCVEVAEKRTKIMHVTENNIVQPTTNMIFSPNNSNCIINVDGKEHENGTEFLSAQEERNEALDSSGIDPSVIYFTHQQFALNRAEMGAFPHDPNLGNETNEGNDAYKNMQQKRKMETWNDVHNHRSSESDSGKGVKTAKTGGGGENVREIWGNWNNMKGDIQEEVLHLNEEEANHGDDEREEPIGEDYEHAESKRSTCRVKAPTIARENIVHEYKPINEVPEEKELPYVPYSTVNESVKLIEQNLNNIKLNKSVHEEDSENEEMILPSFDSDSLSSSQSCLTVVGNNANLFTVKRKPKKKKKIRRRGRLTSAYAKRMRNRSNSSSSNMAYNSSDSMESDDSDSSSDDSSALHLTAFHLQSHHCIPRHRRPFPSTLSDSSSDSLSRCSAGSSDDDSSKVSELRGGLKDNDDPDNSNNSSNRQSGNNNGGKEEESDSTCSDFTRATRSFFLLVSNRDVYRYLAIPLKKYGNYKLWELHEKTNKESNDLFPSLEILYLPYHRKTKVLHPSKKGDCRLVFFKYFDIFKHERINDSSLICLDILNCNEYIKPRHLEKKALEKIIKAMEKGYITKYSYDFLVQYLKNRRLLPAYPLRFKIFVEYNNYRHMLKLDRSLISNRVIAGDILVFNFLSNDAMEEAKINTFREGKRREDFDFTHEYQTRYSARSNSNMNLKILYKKVKLITHLERWVNCSYLVNNRDGTHYRVRVLTDQEEMELTQRKAKEMEMRERKMRERKMREQMMKQNDMVKDMGGESIHRKTEKDERGYHNIQGERKEVTEVTGMMEAGMQVNGNIQAEENQGKGIGDIQNNELSQVGGYDMCGKGIEAMTTKENGIINHVQENVMGNKVGVTVTVDHITNDERKMHTNVQKSQEKKYSGEDKENDKNNMTCNYGKLQSSGSEVSFGSSSDDRDSFDKIPLSINDDEGTEKCKHEYVIRKDEQSTLHTLSELLNFDKLNSLLNANCSVGDKDIKALYVYLKKNKNKYGQGYGMQHTYIFSLVDKDSHEIVKLLNACITKSIKDPVEVEEYVIDKNRLLCRDHQYPFYSPSSSDIVIEKDTGVNMHRKKKRMRMEKEEKLKRGRFFGRKVNRGKKIKKLKNKKGGKNLQEDEHFCEFMNYQHEPPNLCNGKLILNQGKEEAYENITEQKNDVMKGSRRKPKSASGEKAQQNISEEEADEEEGKKEKGNIKNKDRKHEKIPNEDYETTANNNIIKEKQTEKQNEENEHAKKEAGGEAEKEEEKIEKDGDEDEDETGDEHTGKNNERNSKYIQGCMCAYSSEISYCSSARSSLTFTSETSDYYLEDFKEDCLELGHSFQIFDHKKKQKELRKIMKQKMKRKKTSRSREGKNGGSADAAKIIVERNKIISESSEGKEEAIAVVGVETGTAIGTAASMYAPYKENEIMEPSISTNNNTLQNESYNMLNATAYMSNNGNMPFHFNCKTTDILIDNEEMAQKNNNIRGLDVRSGEIYRGKMDNTQKEMWQKTAAEVQPVLDLKENAVVRTGDRHMTHFVSVGESDDGSNEDNKMGAFSMRKAKEEKDVSLSSTRPFVDEKEKKKKKKKIIKKVGGTKCEKEPILPFYVICDFYDFVERKMHLYTFRFKVYDPIYQLGKYRNCVGMCLKRKIKKKTLNYIDSFYKFFKREIDKIDVEIDVRGPTKRIFQHVCHKLNIDPARVLIYPFPPMLTPINYTPYNIDSVSCLIDVEGESNVKGNRNMLEPTCFQYFYNKLTAINDPFVLMEERTCYLLLLPLHYKYIYRSYMKRCTRHLFYVIQLFNAHVQTVAAFCGHIAYRTSCTLNGKYGIENDGADIIGSFDISDEDSDDGRSIYADRPSINDFSTVQDLINKIKLEMNPYLKKRGVDPKQRFRLSYIADTRIRYLKNEEPLICIDFFKNRTITSMFVNPIRMEPDYTDAEKQLLMCGDLKIIQVFHNAPIKAWVGFGFGFEVLVKPTDNMSEIKNRIKKKTLLPRCVFEKLSFFELEDDQRVWKSNDDVINWDKKEIAILIADHNSPCNSRNQKGMKIA